jgi:polyribonucleotide nucleotidyltransferase
MSFALKSTSVNLPDGRTITLETGYLAQQAHGSITVKMGDAVLLATVTEKEEEEKGPFLALFVDYQEKFSGAGRIPGGFFKREGPLNEYEILVSRLVDRSIRPLFPSNYINSLQVNINLLSSDKEVGVEGLAVLAASAALAVSHVPFPAQVASVCVGKKNGELCINPTPSELEESRMNIVVAGTDERIMMLEGSAKEMSEDELVETIKFAHETIKKVCQAQKELAAQVNPEKAECKASEKEAEEEAFEKKVYDALYPAFYDVAKQGLNKKQARVRAFFEAKKAALEPFDADILSEKRHIVSGVTSTVKRQAIRDFILANNRRIDGREPNEVRPIHIAVGYLPGAHGSAVFTRGDTQVLSTLTLGSDSEVQHLDGVSVQGERSFMANYNFPGFATREVRPNRRAGRREIGHGNLVWHALAPMLPESSYTFRLTAETLSSDGSSSMASLCGGSLCFMDAGIKIKKQVAGIAMGLVYESEQDKTVYLSDILSEEDACGDADFKITGTADGITACQMDIKTEGISYESLEKLLSQAKEGRMHILGKMNAVLSEPYSKLKANAPAIEELWVKPSKIGAVIGPRGQVIQDMQAKSGATINVNDDGKVTVFGPNSASVESALSMVQGIISEPEIEKVYKGTIKSLVEYGAFIEFMPGREGLLHVTEMSDDRIDDPADLLELGQEIDVKLISIIKPRDKNGKTKFSLSIKQV